MTTKIRRLSERHFDGVVALFGRTVDEGPLGEILRADLDAGVNGQAVALVAEAADGRVVGFVNTSPHDDFDEGDDSHLDIDTLEIGVLVAAPDEPGVRSKLLDMLIPAVTVREFTRIYRRVPPVEHAVFQREGWQLLPLEYGIAWSDVDDPSSLFVQMPDVGQQIALCETGSDESAWSFRIPDDLDELARAIVTGREFARITQLDVNHLPRE